MKTETNNGIGIYRKLLLIQKELISLKADDKTTQYKYLSGVKLFDHLKPLMNQYGLLLKVEVVDLKTERYDYKLKSGEGKTEVLNTAKMRFTWIDTESGEKDENDFYSTGMNGYDKGTGSAITYAERYFCLKYFHITTDEDSIDKISEKRDQELAKKESFGPSHPKWLIVIQAIKDKKRTVEQAEEKYDISAENKKKLKELAS